MNRLSGFAWLSASLLPLVGCSTRRNLEYVTLSYYEHNTGCYGCPEFRVDLQSGGHAVYTGLSGCGVPGEQNYRIPEGSFRELVRAFNDANFFRIPRLDTRHVWFDVLVIRLAFKDERRIHEVVDVNRQIPRLTQLEKRVRDAARVEKFLWPAVEVYEELMRSGWNVNTLGADHENALTAAVIDRNTEAVQFLLQHGATVSKRALDDAASVEKPETLRLLLAAAKTDLRTVEGGRLLRAASIRRNAEATRLLIEGGAPVNASDPQTCQTPLMAAVDGEALENVVLLLERGANVNAKDHAGHTALWRAAAMTNTGFITLLAQSRAEVNARDNQGRTPLMHASDLCWYWNIKALLAAGADSTIADKRGKTALQPNLVSAGDPNCEISRKMLEEAMRNTAAARQ